MRIFPNTIHYKDEADKRILGLKYSLFGKGQIEAIFSCSTWNNLIFFWRMGRTFTPRHDKMFHVEQFSLQPEMIHPERLEMENRERKIQEKIEGEELIEIMQLQGVKQIILNILIEEKGFLSGEIEIDPEFEITLNDCNAAVSIDFLINISDASFAVVRCVPSAIENWERYVIAFGRAAKDYQIPFAMVTDGEKAKIFDVFSGSLIRESLAQFFTRQEAVELMKNFKKISRSENRIEREKRIIYAFEGIKCAPKKK